MRKLLAPLTSSAGDTWGKGFQVFPPADARGVVKFGQYETWYRITGSLDSGKTPIVIIHGGPGSTHDYLLRLTRLASQGWPVVHYDQLGNGKSTHLPHASPGFWTPRLFLDELENLLRELGINERYILFGQSWGGMLGATHAASRPPGLRGLVIANSPASMPLLLEEVGRLRADLPPDVQKALRVHEEAGTTDSMEYLSAVSVFNERHLCRVPWPDELKASYLEIYTDSTVYQTMNGPNEFHVIGTLKDWSVTDCLPDITAPTLLISGRHDETTPATVQPYFDRIENARWEIFEESGHLPHIEEPERFFEVLTEFLGELS